MSTFWEKIQFVKSSNPETQKIIEEIQKNGCCSNDIEFEYPGIRERWEYYTSLWEIERLMNGEFKGILNISKKYNPESQNSYKMRLCMCYSTFETNPLFKTYYMIRNKILGIN